MRADADQQAILAAQRMAAAAAKRPAVKQPRCSPSFFPLSQTAVPNWALLTTMMAESRLAGAVNVRSYQK